MGAKRKGETYSTEAMRGLARELAPLPRRLRLRQLDGIERLAELVEPSKAYPYALVCYHVTGYENRRAGADVLLPGDTLLADLSTLAEALSQSAQIVADSLGERYWTVQELVERFGVSSKTLSRWRTRGLIAWRVVLGARDGRLIFRERAIRRFVGRHAGLIRRSRAFTQLTDQEKGAMLDLARELAAAKNGCFYRVARAVAEETGRAIETVRYTLRRYDKEHPDAPIFGETHRSVDAPNEKELIFQAYRRGTPVAEVAAQFSVKPAAVYRVITEMRYRRLMETPIDDVYSEEFALPGADTWIRDVDERLEAARLARAAKVPEDVPTWLRHLYHTPLLTRGLEWDLFRKYNYLKYKAHQLRAEIDQSAPKAKQVDLVEQTLAEATEVKDRIIRSNLRLVVSVAKKHAGALLSIGELISDGNMTLMRAVEKFDYARCYKFSTYATWALMKHYARTVPAEHYRRDRYQTGRQEMLDLVEDDQPEAMLDRYATRDLVDRLVDVLDLRERMIVTRHFGLNDEGRTQTLEQIAHLLGISKERVRQLEKRAIDKLRSAVESHQIALDYSG